MTCDRCIFVPPHRCVAPTYYCMYISLTLICPYFDIFRLFSIPRCRERCFTNPFVINIMNKIAEVTLVRTGERFFFYGTSLIFVI